MLKMKTMLSLLPNKNNVIMI